MDVSRQRLYISIDTPAIEAWRRCFSVYISLTVRRVALSRASWKYYGYSCEKRKVFGEDISEDEAVKAL